MTPHQALQNLDKAASMAQLNRQDHEAILQSVNVIKAVIDELEKMKEQPEVKTHAEKK